METAIRWSPRSTSSDPHFLIVDVVGHTFKFCRVKEYKKHHLLWEELSRNTKVPTFRAFDWSPSNNIVAVGQWSGETTVLGLDNRPPILNLPIKSQRQCNAVAFNTSSYLATGLERVRNDFCLNIYDVHQRPDNQSQRNSGAKPSFVDPFRKFATSEGITSIKFFPKQPNTLIAGIKGAVRLYDLRDDSSNPALQYQTLCVHNLAIDPLDENYFASAAPPRDTTVHIWDRRNRIRPVAGRSPSGEGNSHDGPVCELNNFSEKAGPANIWSLRYSSTESGSLGVLGNNGTFRIYRTKKDYVDDTSTPEQDRSSREIHDQYVRQVRVQTLHTVEPYLQNPGRNKNREDADRIVSFDFMNIMTQKGRPCAITLRGNQDVGIYEFPDRPAALAVSARGAVAVTYPTSRESTRQDGVVTRTGLTIKESIEEGKIADQLAFMQDKPSRDRPIRLRKDLDQDSRDSKFRHSNSFLDIYEALLLIDVPRRRCLEGYLFDCEENAKIVIEAGDLQEMWKWIGGILPAC